MSDANSIAELEAQGFTHIEAECSCKQVTAIPFRMLYDQRRITRATMFAELAAKLVCKRCGAKPDKVRPWRQYLDEMHESKSVGWIDPPCGNSGSRSGG